MSFIEEILKLSGGWLGIPREALEKYFAGRRLGHSAETRFPFPRELIPIGARLVLRGWMNRQFFPSHRDWVLPYWAERQFDPQDPAFIAPAGFNLYAINQTHRNWTMIGNLRREREAIVDPRGLVTPWFDGWSLDTWVVLDGTLYAPSRLPEGQVSQSLRENLPVVLTTFRARDLAVRSSVFAIEDDQGGEWVVQKITVENASSNESRATLCLSVRPFNPEGASLVNRVEFASGKATSEDMHGGQPSELSAVIVNGALGVLLPAPGRVSCMNELDGDVALALPSYNGLKLAESKAGLATAVAAYEFELRPRESRDVVAYLPMERHPIPDAEPDALPIISFPRATDLLSKTTSLWQTKMAEGMQVWLPDEKLQEAFEANKAFLLLLHDGKTITPGPFTYHQFWFRDAAFMLNALDKLGYHDEVQKVLGGFFKRLEKDGYLRATEGEWDSNGSAIWSIVENARLSGDKEFIARNYWSILRAASWINSKRHQTTDRESVGGRPWAIGGSSNYPITQSPNHSNNQQNALHEGLLPPGPGAEHLGPSDYYYWDDFWGLAGLAGAARVAEWMGQSRDAAALRRDLESFRAAVERSLGTAAARLGRQAMPASPWRRPDSGMIGNLVALYPLRLFEPDDPRIGDTLAALKQVAWVDGGYFNHVGHSAFGTYLALHVAECYLYRRDPQAWDIIHWVLEHATTTYTWPEGLHPITWHGAVGDGQHGWAAADFVLAVRNALLFEEQDHLVVTPALLEEWTVENNVIKVEKASTYFGKVNLAIAFGDRTGTLAITGEWHAPPEYVEWDLPFPIREAGAETERVEISGKSVRFPSDCRRVVVMW